MPRLPLPSVPSASMREPTSCKQGGITSDEHQQVIDELQDIIDDTYPAHHRPLRSLRHGQAEAGGLKRTVHDTVICYNSAEKEGVGFLFR